MKKIITVLSLSFVFILFIFLFVPANSVNAETGSWYRVEDDGVVFYKQPIDSDSQKLFLLEKSYYVFAATANSDFLYVQLFENYGGFAKINGYVKASAVKLCTEAPVTPYYPTETLTVNQSNALLKGEPSISGTDLAVAFSGQSVCYYGTAWQNPDWYYVKYQTDFGYVQKRQLSTLLIPLHPTPITQPEPEAPEQPTDDGNDPVTETPPPEEEASSSAWEWILILLICIPAVIIVMLLFMPQKKQKSKKFQPPKPKYMTENDIFDDLDLL